MLPHPTHDRLIALGLAGMAKAFEEQRQQSAVMALTFEERLGLLVDREAVERQTKRLVTRLKFANLRQNAAVVTSGVNFTQNHRFEIPDDVVSASGPDPIKGAAVLGPIKAKPCGWPRRRGQP